MPPDRMILLKDNLTTVQKNYNFKYIQYLHNVAVYVFMYDYVQL